MRRSRSKRGICFYKTKVLIRTGAPVRSTWQRTCVSFIDGLIVDDIHGQNEERLNLMPLADMCDSGEEKQLTELTVGIDDMSGGVST